MNSTFERMQKLAEVGDCEVSLTFEKGKWRARSRFSCGDEYVSSLINRLVDYDRKRLAENDSAKKAIDASLNRWLGIE